MYIIEAQNAASTKISVTNTATALYSLMNTGGSITNSSEYYRGKDANALLISCEDGAVRVLNGVNPTSTQGILLNQDVTYLLPGLDLNDLRFIRVGGSDVACSVQPCKTEPAEGGWAVNYNE